MVEKGKEPVGSPLPPALLEFLELYAAGRFWDSHEVLEVPWRERGSDFYQGLILYASAFVHHGRGNAHGVRAQLRKALERLDGYPDAYLGLDVAALRDHCRRAQRTVEAHPADWPHRVAPLPLRLDPERVRGDEAELGDAAGVDRADPDD